MLNAKNWIALALVASAACAWADDDDDAKRALKLSGSLGLTGFRDMVDARTPGVLSVRGGLRYHVDVTDQDFKGAIDATRKAQRHELSLYAGGSLLGMIDVAGRVPYLITREETNRFGLPDLSADDDYGWGDVDLAAKVSLSLGLIDAAVFATGRIPSGEPAVRDLGQFEYGLAASLTLFNHHFAAHGNVSGLQVEEGLSALRYRVGASFVLLDFDALLLRVYAYGDGIEYEGRANSDIDVDFGVQAILFEFVSVELGTTLRVIDGNFLDKDTRRQLIQQGITDRHFDDDGTWAVELGVGIVF
ncbi:MAG: hypothetical protein R3F62_26145 [Planctomycetota bacterium]